MRLRAPGHALEQRGSYEEPQASLGHYMGWSRYWWGCKCGLELTDPWQPRRIARELHQLHLARLEATK